VELNNFYYVFICCNCLIFENWEGILLHEWALAEAVVKTALEVLEREKGKRLVELNLVIGELQTIDMEAFMFALKEISKGTPMENAKINVEYEKPEFKCLQCGFEWSIESLEKILNEEQIEAIHFIPELSHAFISCPRCGSPDFEVIKGRGVYIRSVKIEG